MAQDALLLRVVLGGVVLGQAGHHVHQGLLIHFPLRVGQRQVAQQFQNAAADHGGGGAVPGLIAFGEVQIPVADVIFRQMRQEVIQNITGRLQEGLVPGVGIAQGKAVNAPGLAPCPAGSVAVTLGGSAEPRLAGFHIHVVGVVGGVVGTDDIFAGLAGVAVGDFLVRRIAGDPAGLVQQRQVQQAVDDHAAPVFRIGQIAPGLNDPGFREIPGFEVIGGLDKGGFRPLVPQQMHGRAAGQGIQETQIVGIDIAGLFHPFIEAFQLGFQGLQIGVIFGVFPQQPQHAAVERGGPLKVFRLLGITQPFRVGSGEGIVETATELIDFRFAEVQLLQGEGGGQHIVALVHHVSSF